MYQYSCKNDDIVGSLQNQILEIYVIVILQIIMFYYAFIVLTIDVIYILIEHQVRVLSMQSLFFRSSFQKRIKDI